MNPNSSLIDRAGLDRVRVGKLIERGLEGADDGELFLEYKQSEMLVFDNGRLKQATYDTNQGFGLRAVKDEAVGYAHASDVSEAAIARAAEAVRAVQGRLFRQLSPRPRPAPTRKLYGDENPLEAPGFDAKVKLLETIDAYARAQGPARAAGHREPRRILAGGRDRARRTARPIATSVRWCASTSRWWRAYGDRQESGSLRLRRPRGLPALHRHRSPGSTRSTRRCARRWSISKSIPAPAGEMDVVLGPGWPGVMLHEAVGHGLEGDFNRKKTSAFAGLMGQQVAAKGVTVVDDGTIASRRGSLSIDDEGTPTNRTVLIEDGILVGYMQDRQNARLMGMKPTGNGRRESYAHVPMPRMTNTYMLAGDRDPAEIIASVKNGIYAVNFGGGQVDITSGKFVFQVTEAYKIENGKLGAPLKGAMLIGNGPTDLNRVTHDRQRPRSSTPASAPAARTARACRSASASRRCAWTASRSAGRGETLRRSTAPRRTCSTACAAAG